MKKTAAILLSLLLGCLALAGCGQNAAAPPSEWRMTSVQSGADGNVCAVGTEQIRESHPDAALTEVACRLSGTEIALSHPSTGETLKGACRVIKQADQSTIYEIDFETGVSGHAVLAAVTYADGTQADRLLVSLPDFVLSFERSGAN